MLERFFFVQGELGGHGSSTIDRVAAIEQVRNDGLRLARFSLLHGGQRDRAAACRSLERLGSAGYGRASFEVGHVLARGLGDIPRAPGLSREWLKLAKRQGDRRAWPLLAELAREPAGPGPGHSQPPPPSAPSRAMAPVGPCRWELRARSHAASEAERAQARENRTPPPSPNTLHSAWEPCSP